MQRRKPPVTRIVPPPATAGQATVTAVTERDRGLLPVATARATVTGSVDKEAPALPQTANLAVLLVNFSDYGPPPWTPGFMADLYFGETAPSVADHYNRSSWGHFQVTGDVHGWYPIDMLSTEHSLDTIAELAEAAATADGVVLSNYTHKVYLFPKATTYTFSGSSYWGGDWAYINFDLTGCTEAAGKDNCQTFHTLPHELGHNIGWDHAGTLACTDGPAKVVLSNTSTFATLGDQFDDMGCCTPSLFSNVRRLQAGWIPLSQMVTVTQSGTYTITPLEAAESTVYRVTDGTGQFLYFENRAAAEPPTWPAVWPTGNLLIRRCPDIDPALNQQPRTELLYGQPNSPSPNVKGLPPGQGFTLPNAPVTVTNQSYDGTNNHVQVTFS